VALFASKNAADQALWRDWYRFTLELALLGAFSADATEQKMARVFITDALAAGKARRTTCLPAPAATRGALEALPPPGPHVLVRVQFPLRARRRRPAEKAALGDHTPAGYQQRARFYAISDEGRLQLRQERRRYIVFLAGEHRPGRRCRSC
jgi:hypothetical protein